MAVLKCFLKCALYILAMAILLIPVAQAGDVYMGFVTSMNTSTVQVFDTNTNSLITSFPTGGTPRGIAVNPSGTRIYVANYADNSITVYDTTGYIQIAKISVPIKPTNCKLNDVGDKLYVMNREWGQVYVVDATRNTIRGTISLSQNSASDMFQMGNTIYIAMWSAEKIAMVDATTDTVTGYIDIKGNQPYGIVGNPNTKRIYVMCQETSNSVLVIDTATNTVIATIPVGNHPIYGTVTKDGSRVYVTNQGGCSVSVIDATANCVTATIDLGSSPIDLALEPNEQRLYVAMVNNATVKVISTSSNTIISSINTPYCQPFKMTIAKLSQETSFTIPIQVTFIINTDAIKFHKNVNVSVYDAYTGVFIGSDPTDDNGGSIFWLIPGKRYLVRLDSQDPLMAMQLEVQIQPSDNEYWINVIDTNQGIIASRSIVDSLYKQHYVKIVVNGNIGPISLKRQPWMNVDVYRGNILLYTGNTGTTGEISYRLSYDVYYRIHVYNQTMDIDKTVYTYANDPTVYINTRMSQNPGGILANNNSTITTGTGTGNVLRDVQTRVYTTKDGTNGQIICEYNDASHQTINVTFQLYGRNITGPNDILIQTQTINNNNCTHTFTIQQCNGREFRVVITGHNSRYGDVIRTYTPRFADEKLLPGVPRDLHPIIALLLIGAIGLIFTHITMGVGGCCMVAAGMILQGWGWFTGVPDGVMQVILWLGGFASLILIFIESRGD